MTTDTKHDNSTELITSTSVPPSTTVLQRLLDEELAFSPSFRGRYSNHGAMALVALHQMGASPERLEAEFAQRAREESEPRDDVDELGVRLAEIERDGIAPTVATRVPQLASGPGSQLFHPLIRLAYALGVGHAGQVAAALLDWERRFQQGPTASPDTVALDTVALDVVSNLALAAHATADDFVTLHFVTGARALRVVSGWVDDATAQQLAARAAAYMTEAYARLGAPPLADAERLDALRRVPLPDRATIAERAIESTDAHVIKLADVALAEEERTGDPLYRYLAARWLHSA
jgi:hypothetical protein